MSNDARWSMSRRDWLTSTSAGFGALAFASLAHATGPHHAARAQRVIFLYMRGGPCQMETFDPKPQLDRDHGKPSKNPRMKFLASRWKFRPHGKSGLEISELYPHLATQADSLCVLRGMVSDHINHPEASDVLHTGSFQFERPSLGSWVLYGLGSANRDLPGFVSVKPPTQWGGARYYGSAFLPAAYQGMPIGTMTQPLKNAKVPHLAAAGSATNQRRTLDFVQGLNRDFAARADAPAAIEGVIESYELAFRMQAQLPGLIDLASETKETQALYGIGEPHTDDFGRQCLLARRLVEKGVRFVELTHDNWDHHGGVATSMPAKCRETDKPIAGLIADLQRRGLLDDTLVIWGGEFGRTPDDPTDNGRGHNKDGFTMWLAGGGTRRGYVHGATDDHGYAAVTGQVHVHDLHATILHLLGLDHTKLTHRYAGRDFRLTDVHGRVVRDVLA